MPQSGVYATPHKGLINKTHDNMLHDHGLRLRDIEHDVEDIKNKGDN